MPYYERGHELGRPYDAKRSARAITTSHATITRDVIAPAVILAFSLNVYGRAMADHKSNWANQ
jgi:hypothetical protein